MIQDIAPHHLDNMFHPGRTASDGSLVFALSGKKFLVSKDRGDIVFPTYAQYRAMCPTAAKKNELVYLFTMDDTDCFWDRTDREWNGQDEQTGFGF